MKKFIISVVVLMVLAGLLAAFNSDSNESKAWTDEELMEEYLIINDKDFDDLKITESESDNCVDYICYKEGKVSGFGTVSRGYAKNVVKNHVTLN